MPSADCDDNDTSSIFSYDGKGDPDRISLRRLADAVEQFFKTSCKLTKLEEGGFHKVYEIFGTDGMSKNAVVRVASPAFLFPGDKMKSEVGFKFNGFTWLLS